MSTDIEREDLSFGACANTERAPGNANGPDAVENSNGRDGLMLSIRDINKQFDGRDVLKGLSFEGLITSLAIIGPSGSGKSTLLRILGGLIEPTSGALEIGGEPVNFDESGLLSYRKRIGFVFQDGGLFHHMTALQNIASPLHIVHGKEKDEADEMAASLLERFGLKHDMGKLPAQLSGGQKQRVAIARAIAPSPELLLLDEPTSALDPEYTTEILDMIRGLQKSGTRFIIVTHEMGFAKRACADAAFLFDGRLLEHGRSQELFDEPSSPELRQFLSRLLEWSI